MLRIAGLVGSAGAGMVISLPGLAQVNPNPSIFSEPPYNRSGRSVSVDSSSGMTAPGAMSQSTIQAQTQTPGSTGSGTTTGGNATGNESLPRGLNNSEGTTQPTGSGDVNNTVNPGSGRTTGSPGNTAPYSGTTVSPERSYPTGVPGGSTGSGVTTGGDANQQVEEQSGGSSVNNSSETTIQRRTQVQQRTIQQQTETAPTNDTTVDTNTNVSPATENQSVQGLW